MNLEIIVPINKCTIMDTIDEIFVHYRLQRPLKIVI